MTVAQPSTRTLRLIVDVWRQAGPDASGAFETYEVDDATPAMSLLELLDRINAQLVEADREPVVFDHDCREGVCGSCGFVVDGRPHGPEVNVPTCQQHLRSFSDGDHIMIEPFRAAAFPIVRDLMVDRSALDRIIAAGGYVSTVTGSAPEANSIPVAKPDAELAFDLAACIGCGACVAACPNAAAHLFTSAKVRHLAVLPQGAPEKTARALAMAEAMDAEFGGCSDVGLCARVCPAGVPISAIAAFNADVLRAKIGRGWVRKKAAPAVL